MTTTMAPWDVGFEPADLQHRKVAELTADQDPGYGGLPAIHRMGAGRQVDARDAAHASRCALVLAEAGCSSASAWWSRRAAQLTAAARRGTSS